MLRTFFLSWLALSLPARAQEEPERAPNAAHWEGLEEWAESVVGADGRWAGPRVPWPMPRSRPAVETDRRNSLLLPIAVHAEAASASSARLEEALAGLEAAHLALELERWPRPPADGGRGGTPDFDLYLRSEAAFEEPPPSFPTERASSSRLVRVGTDVPLLLADFDGATSFAELGADVPDDRVFACAVQAYVEAALLSADVAEAPAVRRAIAVWWTERLTGALGCDEQRVIDQQLHPERGFVGHDPVSGEGGVIFLGALAQRHDRGRGTFLPAVFDGMRQWTRDGGEPYALPDFWWTTGMVLMRADDDLLRFVRELSVSRYFTGSRRGGRFSWLDRLPHEASPPTFSETRWERLPRTLPCDLEVEPYGTAYARVEVDAAPAGARLRVWLEGEFGVQWSLGAVRLDPSGRDLAHTFAPARDEPRSYLSVELLPGTAAVLLAVTNFGGRGLDADEVDDHARSFRLVVDRGR